MDTILWIIGLSILGVIAITMFVIAVRGNIYVHYEKHVVEEKRMSEQELEIAKQNLAEMKRYNDAIAEANGQNNEVRRAMTKTMQDLLGVDTDGGDGSN